MARQIDTDAVINWIRAAEQGSNPASPAAGYWNLFIKSDGLYLKDSGGNVLGPIRGAALDTVWDAAGDLLVGTGANTGGRLAKGTARQILTMKSDASTVEWASTLTDWTPTVTQSGAVACTVTYAKYCYIGPLLYICGNLAITAAGTGNNDIKIGNLPANPAANGVYGTAWINDAGTTFYSGSFIYVTAGAFTVRAHLEGDDVGSDPNFALANGDAIMFFAMYPV